MYVQCCNFISDITEIERVQKGEPKKESETYLDLFTAKNVRVKERVLIPVKQYPRVSVKKYIVSLHIILKKNFCHWLTFYIL